MPETPPNKPFSWETFKGTRHLESFDDADTVTHRMKQDVAEDAKFHLYVLVAILGVAVLTALSILSVTSQRLFNLTFLDIFFHAW